MRALIHLILMLASPGFSSGAVIIDNFRVGGLEFTSASSISQEGLDTNSVLAGRRTVSGSALRSAPMDVRVNTSDGIFSFSSNDFGYFSVTYIIDPPNQLDLIASGYSAFLLEFSFVDPRFWRGLYELNVDGVRYNLARELFALDGAGVIEVPFSVFTNATSFSPSEIVFSGARVEPNLRLELSAISAIPEPSSHFLLIAAATLIYIFSRTRRVVATPTSRLVSTHSRNYNPHP
jgi:hypothetical protein